MTLESRLVAAFEAVAADIKALWSVSAGGEGPSSPPLTLVASEALDAGNFVNIFTDAGAAKVRKASASLARSADGFVVSSFPAGSLAVIKPLGEPHTHSSGLTPGREYWLGESGGISEFPPSANEVYAVAQTVGVAVNTSTIKTAEKFAKTIDNTTPLILSDKDINVEPGVPLSHQLQVSGGIPPYKLTQRNFPDWLSVSPEGVLQGTAPTGYASGTYGIDICDARPVCITSNISVLSGRKYWRIFITASNENYATQIVELEFDNEQLKNGTPIGSPIAGENSQINLLAAFNGVKTDDKFFSTIFVGGTAYLGYIFDKTKLVNSVSVTVRSGLSQFYPTAFTVQSSYDGISWLNEWKVTTGTWTSGQTKTFNRPAP